jgi:hypothetical protein
LEGGEKEGKGVSTRWVGEEENEKNVKLWGGWEVWRGWFSSRGGKKGEKNSALARGKLAVVFFHAKFPKR